MQAWGRRVAFVGLLPFLAACAGLGTALHEVTLVARLSVQEPRTTQALVQRNTKAQIKTLALDLYTVAGSQVRPHLYDGATNSFSIERAALDSTFRLKGLAPNTTYRLKARAYNDLGKLISTQDSRSETDVAIALDDQVAATLRVQLTDVVFAATASGGFAVTPGGLTDSAEAPGIALQ